MARSAILGFALLLASTATALGARVEELPAAPPDAAARLLEAGLADPPSLFWFRPPEDSPPTIAPDPPVRFEPPAPERGDRPGWFLRTVPMVATEALADFRLRDARLADTAPLDVPPPRAEIVPEPATILLFLLGFLLLLLARRRS